MLAYGPMQQGGTYWCYVAVRPSRYEEFKREAASKRMNPARLADYGEVIVSGDGLLPPGEVTQTVANMFNLDPRALFAEADPLVEINKRIEDINNS